ncbi:MAG TPA: TolC family protein, partial [Bacteroidota bacterium]|nr:TolC family protein [Bacteroidota bacterium]
IPNYYAITLSVDLPFLNRNQGNVEASVMTLEANKRSRDLMRKSVQADVADACQKAVETDRLYKSFDRKLVAQYEELVEGMVNNYERRNIGIVEFTDFFEAYRTSMVQIYQLENNRLDEIENLNAAVGADIVEF